MPEDFNIISRHLAIYSFICYAPIVHIASESHLGKLCRLELILVQVDYPRYIYPIIAIVRNQRVQDRPLYQPFSPVVTQIFLNIRIILFGRRQDIVNESYNILLDF